MRRHDTRSMTRELLEETKTMKTMTPMRRALILVTMLGLGASACTESQATRATMNNDTTPVTPTTPMPPVTTPTNAVTPTTPTPTTPPVSPDGFDEQGHGEPPNMGVTGELHGWWTAVVTSAELPATELEGEFESEPADAILGAPFVTFEVVQATGEEQGSGSFIMAYASGLGGFDGQLGSVRFGQGVMLVDWVAGQANKPYTLRVDSMLDDDTLSGEITSTYDIAGTRYVVEVRRLED